MNNAEIRRAVEAELCRAKQKWPEYYDDIIHAVSVINEESGEAVQAALDMTYDNGDIEKVKAEVIQTAAMCFRFLENIENITTYQHKTK